MVPCGLGTRLRLVGEGDVILHNTALTSMCKVADCFLVNPSFHDKYQILGFLEFGVWSWILWILGCSNYASIITNRANHTRQTAKPLPWFKFWRISRGADNSTALEECSCGVTYTCDWCNTQDSNAATLECSCGGEGELHHCKVLHWWNDCIIETWQSFFCQHCQSTVTLSYSELV